MLGFSISWDVGFWSGCMGWLPLLLLCGQGCCCVSPVAPVGDCACSWCCRIFPRLVLLAGGLLCLSPVEHWGSFVSVVFGGVFVAAAGLFPFGVAVTGAFVG